MKLYKLILALGAALMCLAACTKDGVSGNKVTVNGASYTNVKATYFIENEHFFWLNLVLTEDGKTTARGMLDTPRMEQDLGRTVKINDNLGYGDRLFLEVVYPGGKYYTATPESGTQTFKKKDNKHYEINLDAKDQEGKDLKVKVVAEFKDFNELANANL
jgi:hypothetical protein